MLANKNRQALAGLRMQPSQRLLLPSTSKLKLPHPLCKPHPALQHPSALQCALCTLARFSFAPCRSPASASPASV